jgi:K+-sensing histidine kinase KdpD
VFVDAILIQEVFINLISNAIEAMENIPREPKVTIRAAISDDKEMAIEVIDNGPGVDDPEKIFDAFVTTKEKGMGIGLAVSHSIAEAHEGQLSATNNSDFGATFTLKLPIPKSANAYQPPRSISPRIKGELRAVKQRGRQRAKRRIQPFSPLRVENGVPGGKRRRA